MVNIEKSTDKFDIDNEVTTYMLMVKDNHMKKKQEPFRKLALVKLADGYENYCDIFKCSRDAVFIYLGDIAQMPGHGVFIGHAGGGAEFKGKIFAGYHTESFEEWTDQEIIL